MDFRLQVFLKVAQHLSYTKAAKELGVSQPAITKHIQELESQYKVQLFAKQNGKIKITHFGNIFREYASLIVDKYQELSRNMNLLSGANIKGIRIGVCSALGGYIMPALLADFLKKFIDVKVEVVVFQSNMVEQALLEGAIDIAFVDSYGDNNLQLQYEFFTEDNLVLVTNYSTDCTNYITIGEFAKLPVVTNWADVAVNDLIKSSILDSGCDFEQLNTLISLNSLSEVKDFLLKKRDCFAFVPYGAVKDEIDSNRLKEINVDNISINRNIEFVYKKDEDKVRRFIEFSKLWYFYNYE